MKMLRHIAVVTMIAVSAIASAQTPCDTVREGTFLPGLEAGQFLVTCWPVAWNASTVFQDSQGNTLSIGDFQQNDKLTVTGCLEPDGFLVTATTVVKQVPDPASLVFDEQIVLGLGDGQFVVQFATDPASCGGTIGPASPNPAMTLQVGRRYRLSWPFAEDRPLSLSSFAGTARPWEETLLVSGFIEGTWENDPAVNWVENGADSYFTLTPALAAALRFNGSGGFNCVWGAPGALSVISASETTAVADWAQYE